MNDNDLIRQQFEKWMKTNKTAYKPSDDSLTDRAYWTVWQAAINSIPAVSGEPVAWTKIDDTGFVNKPYRAKANAELHYGKNNLCALYTTPPDQSARIEELEVKLKYAMMAAETEAVEVDLRGKRISELEEALARLESAIGVFPE